MENLTFTIKGITSLILHNKSLLGDSESPLCQEIDDKRRGKDIETANWLSWYGCLYINDKKEIIIPGYCIHGCLAKGAGQFKKGAGARVKSSLFVPADSLLKFHHTEKDLKKLYESGEFVFRTLVKIPPRTGGLVPSIRPEFKAWGLSFIVEFEKEDFTPSEVERFVVQAGKTACLGDWRPFHGRFEVENCK